MKLYSIKGGIKLKQNKFADANIINTLPVLDGELFYYPLSNSFCTNSIPVVSKGDVVKAGDLIAKASESGFSIDIHSSVDGIIEDITQIKHSKLITTEGIVIKASEQSGDYTKLTPAKDIESSVKNAGVLGMGGAGFPSYIKFCSSKSQVDTLIINASESEPYLTCDQSILINKADELIETILLIKKELDIKRVIVALEGNTTEQTDKFKQLAKDNSIDIAELPRKYPYSGEKQLIYVLLGRTVKKGEFPSSVKVMIQNISTIYSIYEAIKKSKPVIDRVVTISGDIPTHQNIIVKVGTTVRSLLEKLNLDPEQYNRIILGGLMTGTSIADLDTPLLKTVSAVLLLNDKVASHDEEACARCGRCIDSCVMRLSPTGINNSIVQGDIDQALKDDLMSCIECGCCSYVCISSRKLMESIQYAKNFLVKDHIASLEMEKASGGKK